MKINNALKHLFFFSLFFILFYIETISIGSIKFAVLWKIFLIGIILLYLNSSKSKSLKKFIFFGYLYSLKNFFNESAFASSPYFISASTEVIKSAFIPLLTHGFMLLQKNRNLNLYSMLLTLSIYIVISTIPFLLGIIEPLSKGYDLSLFGLDEAYGFIGIFQVPHSAAVTIAFAIIILIYEIEKNSSSKFKTIYSVLILLGLWAEIQTYARTGFAILLLAGAYLLLVNKSIKYYIKISIPLVLLGTGLYAYYLSSEVLQMRINGTNKHMQNSQTEADVGSGRFKFQEAAIDNLFSSDFQVIAMGLGIEIAKDMMSEDVHLRIYSHNGFVDVLQFNGLIGIVIYSIFLIYMINFIFSHRYSSYYRLNMALLIAYLISMFFQGEHFFLADVILALGLALLVKKENYENN